MNVLKVKTWGKVILEFFFPRFCLSCDLIGSYCCAGCWEAIEVKNEEVVFDENLVIKHLSSLVVYGSYRGVLQNLIHGFKYQFLRELGQRLGELMAEGFTVDDDWLVTFVPLHRERLRWRGFNQAEVLAEFVAGSLGVDCFDTLNRVKKGLIQATLERDERIDNVKGLFEIKTEDLDVCGKRLVIVDDVATTGATLDECARVLKEAGAMEVRGLVLARNVE